jgi:uncharacterized protein (TIGR04255 family)
MADFLYENSPLIEVISEIRWKLLPISSIPDAEIDPFYSSSIEPFTKGAEALGYGVVERLVPADVPIELVARQPVFRFRRNANEWPLLQLGPGVLTSNIVPPYQGWDEFRKSIASSVQLLRDCYPAADRVMQVDQLQLRYLNAFTERHTYSRGSTFLSDCLNVELNLRGKLSDVMDSTAGRGLVGLDLRMLMNTGDGSTGRVNIREGRKFNEDALIVELRMVGGQSPVAGLAVDHVLAWYDSAHSSISELFDTMCSESLKDRMGPKIQLRKR